MTTTELDARARSFLAAEKEVLLAFFFSRMLVWVLAWLAFRWIAHGTAFPVASETEMWNLLFRWDSNWYGRIAQFGYEFFPDKPSSAAFFPLYPLCVRLVGVITGVQVSLAGFLVSNTSLLGAVILLRRLVALDFLAPSRVPERTVWLFLLCPVTFFYSSTYTESLFVFLSVAAVLAARHRRWALAGLAGALLTATRINGLIILVPLLWEAFGESRRSSGSEIVAGGILRSRWWLMIVPLGFVTFATYFYFRFGDALAFAHAQATWLRRFGPPWSALWNTWRGHPPGYGPWFVVRRGGRRDSVSRRVPGAFAEKLSALCRRDGPGPPEPNHSRIASALFERNFSFAHWISGGHRALGRSLSGGVGHKHWFDGRLSRSFRLRLLDDLIAFAAQVECPESRRPHCSRYRSRKFCVSSRHGSSRSPERRE